MGLRRSHLVRAFLALFACGAAFALDPASLKPQGYVSDFANVISPEYKVVLEQYCHAVETATGAQIAVVTVDTLDDAPIEDYTNSLYRKWGIGQKGKNEGLMLLLAVRDRKSRIEVGYGLEPVITDGVTGSTLRQMRPLLTTGQYGPAILGALEALGPKIAEAHQTTIDTTGIDTTGLEGAKRARPQGGSSGFPIGAIIFLIIVIALLSRGGRGGGGGLLTGLILGNVLGRGGSRFGGGFGGFDGGGGGGGGFGGFGGGDSGGGGASSNW